MKIPKRVLHALVTKEAKSIKKNATKKELAALRIRYLDPLDRNRCIYGQMTGDCFSERTTELIVGSGVKVLKSFGQDEDGLRTRGFGGVATAAERNEPSAYYSPIEYFIGQKINKANGNNKALVDFLKGKTKTLKFV